MSGANRSLEIQVLGNIRIAGTKDDRFPGVTFGGIYYPEGTDGAGKKISARWEGSAYINRGSYINNQGDKVDRTPDIVRLVLWNGRSTKGDGKGLADIAAKCFSPGKELSCLGNAHSYQGRIYIDGATRNKADGTIATTLKHSVTVIPGTMNLGADADKQLNFEYGNWDRQPGQISFFSRPRNWSFGQSDHAQWLHISNARMASVFNGGDTYGYALVRQTGSRVAPPQFDQTSNPVAQAFAGVMNMGGNTNQYQQPQYNQPMNQPMGNFPQQVNNAIPQVNNMPTNNMQGMPQMNAPQAGYQTPAGQVF